MKKLLIIISLGVGLFVSCGPDSKKKGNSFLAPEAGTQVKSGEEVAIKMELAGTADSIIYLVDSSVTARKTDSSGLKLATNGLSMGNHLLTAKVYTGGAADEVTSNIVVVPAKAPTLLTYEVVNTYPHDINSFTEGLIYQDGVLYESDGEYDGQSSIRKAALPTGKVISQAVVPGHFFAEGITVIGDKINQLTYREGIRYVYDKATLKKLGEYPFTVGLEGWGMTFDGEKSYMTDGTNNIYILDKDNFQQKGLIQVYDDKGPVNQLNELEYIDGKLYANIYTTNTIVIIDPKTGIVESKIDFSNLYPNRNAEAQEFNGIAWDASGKRLFVTGKKWDKLFEIKIKK